jgi:hypothetical protein
MSTLIVAAVLTIAFIVSLNTLIVTVEASPRRRFTMKKLPLAFFVLGGILFSSACSTPHKSEGAKQYKSNQYKSGQSNSKNSAGYVKRAVFTTAIKNREPTNDIRKLRNTQHKIYYFTEIRSMQGKMVKHRWVYKGKVMAEVKFKVKGPRWRVYSSKRLEGNWLGDWAVLTVDQNGTILSKNRFSYTRASGASDIRKLNKSPTKVSSNPSYKSSSEESYLDLGTRKVGEMYDGLFGND